MLALIGIISTFAYRGLKISEIDFRSKRSYFLAEAGIEDALYRAKRGKFLPASYAISFYGANTTITVTNIAGGKEIESASNINDIHRIIKSTIKQGTGVGFSYAVQVGRGGINLENSSKIVGSVYSNGDISGRNTAEITEDAYAASDSSITGDNSFSVRGNARAHLIDNMTISKSASSTTLISDSTIGVNAYADSISSSSITKDAHYLTSIAGTTVGGSTYPGSTPPADLPEIDFPITDAQVTNWENVAAAGGVHSSPCPYVIDDGTVNLGPIKINCDLTITNDAIINVRGTIWVNGNFTMRNTSQLKLDPSYGPNSEVLVADNISNRSASGKILLEDTVQVSGSGYSGSYVALISGNNSAEMGGAEVAIRPKNSVDASIYYARHGLIELENSVALKEVTAYQLNLKNTATVTYESGLASTQFSGPTGGFDITGWLEVP